MAFAGTNELLERPGARKRIGQTEQLTGMLTGKGQMQVEADPDTLGTLLLLAVGAKAVLPHTHRCVCFEMPI